MTVEELKEKIAEEVGYTLVPEGYADSGNRKYGACNDSLIELCHKLLTSK